MKIPFLDLQKSYIELYVEINEAINKALQSGCYIGGDYVSVFENTFRSYVGADHCVGLANGLDALHLALKAMNVGPGDEVIVPAHTYIATWLAVSHTGAKIVPVEPIENTYNINPDKIEKAITAKTKVIIPVHLYGQPADLDPIILLAKKYGLMVLEDAAQAHGAKYKGKRIGSHGDIVAWSFYPGKNLGAFGDGGAITTNNTRFADKIRQYGNYGSSIKYHHELVGFNSRLDPIQASVLTVKLQYLDEWNSRRSGIAKIYSEGLTGSSYILPHVPEWTDPVWHLYVIRTSKRKYVQDMLNESGIGSLIHYPTPPHLQPAYKHAAFNRKCLETSEKISDEVLSIPISPHISDQDALEVIENLLLIDKQN